MSHWDEFGRGPRGHRVERGDLRYVILDLLKDHPSYGYEIIRAVEERFHGFYTPSPGTVYPTLQWLEDLGYVTVAEREGRKIYTITEEGRRFLIAHETDVEEIRERLHGWWGAVGFDQREFRGEMHDLMHELRDMGKDLRNEMRWADPDKLRRVREVVMRAGREVEDILREAPRGAGQSAAASGPAPAASKKEEPPSEGSTHNDEAAGI